MARRVQSEMSSIHSTQISVKAAVIITIKTCARGDTICPRPARSTRAAAHLQSIAYTPYTCGAQHVFRHEYS